jgi:hypothetical protein
LQISVGVKLLKGGQEVSLGGFKERDNVAGPAGSPLSVTFTGLTPGAAESGAGYSLSFTTFYQGYILTYQTNETVILPSAVALAPPASPAEDDNGPWLVHETIGPLSVRLQSADGTLSSGIVQADGLFVTARLINKGGVGDLSVSHLLGNRTVPVDGGLAVFKNLRVTGVAGAGYALAFYLQRSERLCGATTLYSLCQSWAQKRGVAGGAFGGYIAEALRSDITIVPDRISATRQGTLAVVRVDETLSPYLVRLSDSISGSISSITAADGFSVTARLLDAHGGEATEHLAGTRIIQFASDSATFDDLTVIGTAGEAFQLVFEPSWRPRCDLQLVDLTCSLGSCCIKPPSFTVFPYALVIVQPSPIPDVYEGEGGPGYYSAGQGAINDIVVDLTDFSGARMTGISSASGMSVLASISQRGSILYSALQPIAAATSTVSNGKFPPPNPHRLYARPDLSLLNHLIDWTTEKKIAPQGVRHSRGSR